MARKTDSSNDAQQPEEGWSDMVRTLLFAVIIAFSVRTFLFEPFTIPSGSMLPDLLIGDYLFVSKYSYGYSRFSIPLGLPIFHGRLLETTPVSHPPERGDVVVFKLPSNTSVDYIKRLIGLPGDHIRMQEGQLYINGAEVKREQIGAMEVERSPGIKVPVVEYMETLPNGKKHVIIKEGDDEPLDNTPEFVVPPDHYFFMGDNRDNSQDSRTTAVGYVPAENLVGRASLIFFSLNDGTKFWEIWKWPSALRMHRFFTWIE